MITAIIRDNIYDDMRRYPINIIKKTTKKEMFAEYGETIG